MFAAMWMATVATALADDACPPHSDTMMADAKFVKGSQKRCRQQNSCDCESLAGAYLAGQDLAQARVYADLACAQGSASACALVAQLDHPAPFAGTEIPLLGVRVGCQGSVQMAGEVAVVACGDLQLAVTAAAGADLAAATAEAREAAKSSGWGEEVTFLRDEHTASVARLEYVAEELYQSTVLVAIGGEVYACGGTNLLSAAEASAVSDACSTLEAGSPGAEYTPAVPPPGAATTLLAPLPVQLPCSGRVQEATADHAYVLCGPIQFAVRLMPATGFAEQSAALAVDLADATVVRRRDEAGTLHLEYTYGGARPVYYVRVLREIAGREYRCESPGTLSPAEAAVFGEVCASLRAP